MAHQRHSLDQTLNSPVRVSIMAALVGVDDMSLELFGTPSSSPTQPSASTSPAWRRVATSGSPRDMGASGPAPGCAAPMPAGWHSAGTRAPSRRSSEAPAQPEPGGAASGADFAADVGEGVADLLPQRGEDE